MFELNPDSGVPYYQQIAQDLRNKIMTAKVHAHEQLPSVRTLARTLRINPNTVQKAYRLLKEEQLIYSVAGRGDFVADNVKIIRELKHDNIVEAIVSATKKARDAGIWIDEIFRIIDEAYSEP